ncbi:MAG TPA: hypothetical protein VHO91_13790 [Rhodopila sp.]|nr:hypothetical protein [Rhodopila sp.]
MPTSVVHWNGAACSKNEISVATDAIGRVAGMTGEGGGMVWLLLDDIGRLVTAPLP